MIYEYPQEKRIELIPLFKEHRYLDAIVLGLVASKLGKVYVDNLKKPNNVMLMFGENPTVIGLGGSGEGKAAKELISITQNRTGFFCPNKKWKELILERFGEKIQFKPRTKLSSSKLDIKHIRKLKENIPDGYEIKKINEEIIDRFEERTKFKIKRFVGSLEYFKKNGFGFCVIHNGKIVGDVTNGGLLFENAFELDIEIHPEHRRKGLATILCAYLIEYSLESGYDPRWDAANQPSVSLALKLGYTNPEEHELMIYWVD